MYTYYYLLLFLSFVYVVIYVSKVKKKSIAYITSAFFFMILLSGIRGYEIGGDLQHYLRNFPDYGQMSCGEILSDRSKYGYVFALLCKVAFMLSSSSTSFLFVTSIVNLCLVAYYLKRFSLSPWLSIFIYITFGFYTNTFNSVRSSIALGIGLVLIKFIVERKLWKFLLGFLLALEVHQTFFPFIVLYFLYTKQVTLKYMIICIASCVLFSQLSSHMSFISLLAFAYDSGAYGDIEGSSTGGKSFLFLMILMTFAFYYVNKEHMALVKNKKYNEIKTNKKKKSSYVINLYMHCMVIACCILAFATYYTVLTRVAMFFYVIVITFLPISISNITSHKLRKIGYFGTICLFLTYFSITIMKPIPGIGTNYQGTIPYKTYWEH